MKATIAKLLIGFGTLIEDDLASFFEDCMSTAEAAGGRVCRWGFSLLPPENVYPGFSSNGEVDRSIEVAVHLDKKD